MRKLAKAEYKKMMAGIKRANRPTFAQAWPLIKATLEGKDRDAPQELTVEDAAAVDQMLIGSEIEPTSATEAAEHVHGPGCSHGPEEIKI